VRGFPQPTARCSADKPGWCKVVRIRRRKRVMLAISLSHNCKLGNVDRINRAFGRRVVAACWKLFGIALLILVSLPPTVEARDGDPGCFRGPGQLWIGCRWYGTKPICRGECPGGYFERDRSGRGCISGSKVYCCIRNPAWHCQGRR